MTTLLLTHSACLYHETPPGHPECSDRLRAVLRALEDENAQLNKLLAEAMLDNVVLKDLASKKW